MEKTNNIYKTPDIVVIELDESDVITLSDGSDNEGNMPGGWTPKIQ